MYLALHLPDFSLYSRLLHTPGLASSPVALLDGGLIRQLTPAARRAGVEANQNATQGQARCANLQLLSPCPENEQLVQDLLLASAASLSPDFESTAAGLVTADISASAARSHSSRLHETGQTLITQLSHPHPLDARIGCAANPDLAALAAHLTTPASPIHLITAQHPDAIREYLAPFPLASIKPPPQLHSILILWGIETLGDLTSLPRDELAKRLGNPATELWDQAAGRRHRLLKLVRPATHFSQLTEFDNYTIETLEPLLFLIRRSLESLAARLTSSYLVASDFTLTLHFFDQSISAHHFRVPEPTCDVDLLLRILHTRLENFTTAQAITGFHLELTPTRPCAQALHLFESTLRDPNRFAETLARLEAMVGSGRVGSPTPANTHQPDQFHLTPFQEKESSHDKPEQNPNPRFPLRRFRPPIPLHLITRRDPRTGDLCPEAILSGKIRGTLQQSTGPWKLSGHWWEKQHHWIRREWDIQLEDHQLYRIAYCNQQWFLEGVYG